MPTDRGRKAADDLDALIEQELTGDVPETTAFIGESDVVTAAPIQPHEDQSARDRDFAFGTVDEALASAFGTTGQTDELGAGSPLASRAAVRSADVLVSRGDDEPSDEVATVAAPLAQLTGGAAPSSFAASFNGEATESAPLHRAPIPDPFDLPDERAAKPSPGPAFPPPIIDLEPPPLGDPQAPSLGLGEAFDDEDDVPTPLVEVDEGEDEDELEANERPGFSLLEELVRQDQMRARGAPALEIITSDRGEVRRVDLLAKARARLTVGRGNVPGLRAGLRLAKLLPRGGADVRFPSDADGVLINEGRQIPIDELKVPSNAVSKRSNAYSIRLRPGQTLTVRWADAGFHLRFVDSPVIPTAPRTSRRIDGPVPRAVGSSLLVHMLVALVVGLSTPAVSFSEASREVWAEIDPDEVRPVEVPEPEPPEPEPEPEPPPPEPKAEPKPKPPPKPKPRRTKRPTPQKVAKAVAPRAGPASPDSAPAPKRPPREVKKAGVLGALGSLGKAAPGRRSVVAAASNLDAVKAPGGSSYRVGALIGKAPTSDIRLGGGGGGKPLTRGSANLLRGGSGFARIGKSSGAKVRGRVTQAVARRVAAKGSISREDVARVINSHMNEVQSCYERALMSNPSLRGKLTVEWTIQSSGQVSGVKQKFSTLQSAQVASCIMSKLKRWRFPKPRGGVVVVSYPFNFAATSY